MVLTGTGGGSFSEAGDGIESRTSYTLVHAVLVLVVAERTWRTTSAACLVVTVLVLYVRARRTRHCTHTHSTNVSRRTITVENRQYMKMIYFKMFKNI